MDDFSPQSNNIDAEIDEILGTKSKKPAKIASPKTVSTDIDTEIDDILSGFSGSDPVGKTVGKPSIKTARKRTSSPYDHFIEDSASRHGVDPDLIRRQMGTESSFNPKAKSNKNAMGLMQLIPDTARRLGVKDIYDPKQNIEGGVKYMRQLLDMFGGDVNLALAGYNAGEGAVKKYGNKVPPYQETRNYVKKIGSGYTGNGYLRTKTPKGETQSTPRDVDPITSIDDEIDSLLAGMPSAPQPPGIPDGSVYNKPADTPTGLPDNLGSATETGTPNEIFQSRTANLESPVDIDALQEAMNVASDQSKLGAISEAIRDGKRFVDIPRPATGKPGQPPIDMPDAPVTQATDADFEEANKYLASVGQPLLTREQFNAAQTTVGKSAQATGYSTRADVPPQAQQAQQTQQRQPEIRGPVAQREPTRWKGAAPKPLLGEDGQPRTDRNGKPIFGSARPLNGDELLKTDLSYLIDLSQVKGDKKAYAVRAVQNALMKQWGLTAEQAMEFVPDDTDLTKENAIRVRVNRGKLAGLVGEDRIRQDYDEERAGVTQDWYQANDAEVRAQKANKPTFDDVSRADFYRPSGDELLDEARYNVTHSLPTTAKDEDAIQQEYERLKKYALTDEEKAEMTRAGENTANWFSPKVAASLSGMMAGGGRVMNWLAGALRLDRSNPISALQFLPESWEVALAKQGNKMTGASALESKLNPGFANAAIRIVSGLPYDLPRYALLSRLPGGAVAMFAADSGLQSAGRGESGNAIIAETAKGAAMGAIFKGAGKLATKAEDFVLKATKNPVFDRVAKGTIPDDKLKNLVNNLQFDAKTQVRMASDPAFRAQVMADVRYAANEEWQKQILLNPQVVANTPKERLAAKLFGEGAKVGSIGTGTAYLTRVTSKASTPEQANEEAWNEGVTMALTSLALDHGKGAAKGMKDLVGRIYRATVGKKTADVTVMPNGDIKLLKGAVPEDVVDASVRVDNGEARFNEQAKNREDIAKSQKEGEAKLNNEIYKRQQAEKTETEKLADRGLPEAPPKRVESPTPEAVTKATNHPVAQRVSTILADGKPRTLDDIARESRLKNADKISEAIDTLYAAGQIQINPDGTVQVNGGERPDTSLYDQFDASGRVKPTTVPTTPVAPVVNTQDADEDLVFTPASAAKKADTKEYPPSGLPALTEADIRKDKFIHPQKNITDLAEQMGKSPDEIREILPTLPDYTDAQIAKKYGVTEAQVANLRPLGEIGHDGYTSHRVRATILDPANEGMFNALSDIFTGGEVRFRDAEFETKGRMADAVLNKIAESVGKPRASQMTAKDWSKVLSVHAGKMNIEAVDKIVEVMEEGKDYTKKFNALVASPKMQAIVAQGMRDFGAVVNADGTIEYHGAPMTWEDLLEVDDNASGRKTGQTRSGGVTLPLRKMALALGKELGGIKENGKPLFTNEAIRRAYDTAVYARTSPSPKGGSNTRKVATVSAASGKESPKRGTAAASSTQKVAPIKVVKKSEPKTEPKAEPKKAPVVAEKAETREEVAPEPKKVTEVKEKPKKPTLEGTKEDIKKEKAPIETLHSVPVTAKGQSTADAQVFIEADIDPTVKLTPNKTSSVWRVKSPDGIEVKGATYQEALDIAQRIADGIATGNYFARSRGKGLVYQKIYAKGGGSYKTQVEGVEVTIEKQNESGKWVAQSYEPLPSTGEYVDIERERLDAVKAELESLASNGTYFSRPNVSTTAVLSQIKPYTTTVLTKLKQFQGRDVKIQTVRETLKQGGIKAQDKKMIERILNRPEFKDANSIPYDELDKAIRLEVMPLQVIETSTYADYGFQNVGVSGNDDRTYIFNSPISHGEKGHFHGDFGSEHRGWDVGEARDRDTGEVTYMAVPVGQTFQGTTEAEATSFVGHASADKNDVENWIAERGLVLTPTNEGLFGHSRVRRDGKDSYNAEDQSDTYQKQNLERMLIESYLNDYRNNKLKIGDVSPELYTTVKKLSNVKTQVYNIKRRPNISISAHEIKDANKRAEHHTAFANLAQAMLDSLTNETAPPEVLKKWAAADPSKDIHAPLSTEDREKWIKSITATTRNLKGAEATLADSMTGVWSGFGNSNEDDVGDEPTRWEIAQKTVADAQLAAEWQVHRASTTLEQIRANVPEYMTYERLVEDEKDLTKDVTKYFTSTDEQFIAHKKNYIARILRETIRIEALAGQERFLIPTAMTAARIEGFVAAKRASGGTVGTANGVYEVENARGNEDTLVQGDTIRMGGELYHVAEATDDTIEVVPDDAVCAYTYRDFAESESQNEWYEMSYEGKRGDGSYWTEKELTDFINYTLYLHTIDVEDYPTYFDTEYDNPDYDPTDEENDEEPTIWVDAGYDTPDGAGEPLTFKFDWSSRKFQDAISNELSNREYDLGEYLTNYANSWAMPRGDGYYYTDEPTETFDQPWVIREREEEAQARENELNIGYRGHTVREMESMWGDLDVLANPEWEARNKVAVAMQRGYGFADAVQVAVESVKGDIDLDPDDGIIVRHSEEMLAELNKLKAEDFAPVEVKEAEAPKKLGHEAIEQPVMKDFSDERQTILKKYIELENLFFDERENVEIVEDKGGNQWLASPLTEADKGDIVVFNKAQEAYDAETVAANEALANNYGGRWENVGRAAEARGDGDMTWMNNAARLIISQAIQERSPWLGVYMTPQGTNELIKGLVGFQIVAQANGDTQLAKGIQRVIAGVMDGIDPQVGDIVLYLETPEAPNLMAYGVQEEKLHRADLRLRGQVSWRTIPIYEQNPSYAMASRNLLDGPYAGAPSSTIHHEIVGKMFRDDAEIELGLTYNQLQSIRLLHYDQLIANGVTDAQIEKAYNNISKNASAWVASRRTKDAQPNTRGVNSTRGSPNAPQFSRLQGSRDGRGKGVDKALAPYPFTRDIAQNVDEKGQRIPQTLFSRPTNIGADAFPDIEGIPESELTMEAHRTRIEKLIADTLPKWLHWVYDGRREVTPAEAIGNTVRAGYLLGVSVVLTNVQGNPVNQVAEQGVKVFSGPLDWLNSKINPKSGYERHSPGLSLLDIAEGMFGKKGVFQKAIFSKGEGSVYEVLRKGVGDEEREKFDLLPLVHSKESKKGRWDENVVRNTGIPAWDAAIEASVRVSSALDRPFKAFKNASEIRGLARLTATKLRKQGAITKTQYYDFVKELNKDPNAWMEAVAKRSAQIDTFQNPNAITDEINKIKKKLLTGRFASDVQDVQARQDAAKLVGQLLYLVMTTTAPFLNTPANIGIRALEYTPVGLALGAVRFAKIGKTLERLEWAERMAERRKKEDARIAKERLQENRDIKSILEKYSAQRKAKKAERDQAIADIEASTVMQPEFKKARIKKAKENYKTWEAGWTEAKAKRAQVVDGKLADAGTERAKIDAGIAADRAREDAEANRKFTALENNAFTSGLGRTAFGTTFGSLFFLGVFMGILKAVGYVNYDDDQKEWEKRRDAGIPDASIGAFGYRFPYDNSPLGKALAIGVTAMEQAQRGGSVEKRVEGSAKGVFKGLRNLFPYTENRFDTDDEWLEIGKTVKSATPFVNMKILEEVANIIDDKPRTTFKQGMTAPFKMTFAREGIPMLGIDPLPVTKHPMGKRHDSMLWRGLQTINPMRSIKQVRGKDWAPSPHKK